jgi:hypothetical protein
VLLGRLAPTSRADAARETPARAWALALVTGLNSVLLKGRGAPVTAGIQVPLVALGRPGQEG